ncbi:MAG: hypothetical protein IJO60_01005 [Agathobacter sp.]|nr:hypothetical protein [Agathobacter sp.]
MKREKRYLIYVVYIIIGAILLGLSFAGKVDEFWNGMGSALVVMGVIQLIRFYRLQKDEAYREKIEIETNDERNHFIRNKAWAWAGYLFVMIMAVACIILRIVGLDMWSMAASGSVCLVLVLFWISYYILKRKY